MVGNAKCGHCDKTGTKAVQIEPAGSRTRYKAICCNHCNSILSAVDDSASDTILKKIETENAALSDKVRRLEYTLEQIVLGLNRL